MFEFRDGSLQAESVSVEAITREFGTPCYVYSRAVVAAARGRGHCGRTRTHLVRERLETLFALEHVLR